MSKAKKNVLGGINNSRLDSTNSTNNEGTAAWAEVSETEGKAEVSIPSALNIEEAKEWVDDGSRL